MLKTETLLVRTKLNRPALIRKNLVPRPRLLDHLNASRELPFILVSAPAGYGKSTLINTYLDTVDCPFSWISLDEHDSNITVFLQYFLTAIRSIFPDTCNKTMQLIEQENLPSVETLAGTIADEINMIDRDFILVLDDYSRIHDMAVHDLLSQILYHPPRCMHLIIASRRDPPLPLIRFRAQGQMTEIRIPDLRFSVSEAAILIRNLVEGAVDDTIINSMIEKTEGWVIGLYMVAVSFRYGNFQNKVNNQKENSSFINDYMLSEVYCHIPATMQDFLLKLSILNRFCDSLCDAICPADGSTFPNVSGHQYLDWIRKEDLFINPLDLEGRWYQLHGLFRNFLQRQLNNRYSSVEIDVLHTRASIWYSQQKIFNEALYHTLAAGNIKAGIHLVAEYLQTFSHPEQWQQLDYLIHLFPPQMIESNPYLLLANSCVMYVNFQLDKLPRMLDKAAMLLTNTESEIYNKDHLLSIIDALRSYYYYWKGDFTNSLLHGEKALTNLPEDWHYIRELTQIQILESIQMFGEENQHVSLIDRQNNTDTGISDQIVQNLRMCSTHWKNASFEGLKSYANNLLTSPQKSDSDFSSGIGHYLIGIVSYFQNDLGIAEQHLSSAFEQKSSATALYFIQTAFGLASVYRAQGKINKSYAVVNEAADYLVKLNDTSLTPLVQAFKAELALSQNGIDDSLHWATRFDPVMFPPMQTFYYPHFTLVKVLLAQNTEESLKQASDILSLLRYYAESSHNKLYLIRILVLETSLKKLTGDTTLTVSTLKQALSLAKESRIIRPFIDMGSVISELIMEMDDGGNDFLQQICDALVAENSSVIKANNKLVVPLTDRELIVMELLTKRFSNKEIADQLKISTGTVKSHTIRIYQKFNVKTRRQAAEKALTLGIFSSVH